MIGVKSKVDPSPVSRTPRLLVAPRSSSSMLSPLSGVSCCSMTGPSPSDWAAMSLSRSRSSTSSSGRGAVISMTSGSIMGMGGGCRIDGLRRPNLKPNASDAATRMLPRFLKGLDEPSLVDGRRAS